MKAPRDKAIRQALIKPLRKWIALKHGVISNIHLDIMKARLDPDYRRNPSSFGVPINIEECDGTVRLQCNSFAPHYIVEAEASDLNDAYAMIGASYRKTMYLMCEKCVPEDFFDLYTLILYDAVTGHCKYRDVGVVPVCSLPFDKLPMDNPHIHVH